MSYRQSGNLAHKLSIFLLSFSLLFLSSSLQAMEEILLESPHFVFHFQNEPNPKVRQEIVNFYEQVASTLEGKFSAKIKFSFLGLERPAPFALEEVAVRAFDFHFAQPPRPIHLYAAFITKEKGFSIEEVLSKGQGDYLPLISFFLFLLEHYNWENFAKLWKYQPDPGKSVLTSTEEAVRCAYGQELSALERQWKDQLETLEISPEWQETIQVTLDMRKLYAEKQREWGQAQSEGGPGNINISPSELPALYFPLKEVLGSAPDDILPEPFPDLKKVQQALKDFEKFSEIATQAINLTQLAQNSARLGESEDAYRYFFKLRQSLVTLGNTSYLPWVDQNLAQLKKKMPPELVRSLEEKVFPWWEWMLISLGAAGVLGLGCWLFLRKRRAGQKEKGKQP
ncbi:MAG: hypothetical protein ACPL7L_02965 [bacterium]